jgi:hypothetical protein
MTTLSSGFFFEEIPFQLIRGAACRYYLLVLVIVSPLFAVANAYGSGLTDFDMSSIYGTVRAHV